MKTCPICMNAMPYEWVVCSCDSRIQGLVRVNLPKIEEQEPKIEEQKMNEYQKKIFAVMGNPFGEPQGPVEKGFHLAGWRRCAEGQGETQHCALLEAAVLAEREACATLVETLLGETPELSEVYVAAEIRARGNNE